MNQNGIPSRHWEIQLETAEEIGLGSRTYNLIPVEIKHENNHEH
jgi:uncharacterized Fe-S center protein